MKELGESLRQHVGGPTGKPPEVMKGLRLDEPFFDAIIKRAGGCRLEEQYPPPQNTRNADYLFDEWIIEHKILVNGPLEADARQAKLHQFIITRYPKPLFVTANRREVRLSQEDQRTFWVEMMGTSIKRAIEDAAEQIVATRTYVPGTPPGAVILVNTNVAAWGWSGFANLVSTYLSRCPAIDAALLIEGLPESPDSKDDYPLHFAAAGRAEGPSPNQLLEKIAKAIAAEIELRTGRPPTLVDREGFGPTPKLAFRFGPNQKLFMPKC